MPAGSIERTTCYGKRLRIVRSLFRIRKMPADRGLRGYRGRPGRAGLPQARGPQALKLRGNPRLRFRGLRASGGRRRLWCVRRHVVSGRKSPAVRLRAFYRRIAKLTVCGRSVRCPSGSPRRGVSSGRRAGVPRDRAVQAQVEDRVHHLFGKCRGVDFGQ